MSAHVVTDAEQGGVGQPDPYPRARPRYRVAIVVSTSGTSMAVLASTFAVYGLSNSILATALVLVLANIPMVLLGSVSAALLHRFGAARVYSACDVALFVVTVGLAALSFAGHLSVPVLFAWQLVCGSVLGLSGASYAVLPHTLAPPGKVPEYNAALSQARSIAALVGLVAGGFVIETVGTSWVFVLDALSFLAVPLALTGVRDRHEAAAAPAPRLRVAADAIIADRGLRAAAAAGALMVLLASPISSLLPAMADRLGASSHFLSAQMAAFAMGGLCIALVVRHVRRRSRWSRAIRAAVAVAGLGLLALAHLERVEASGWLVHATILVILAAAGLAVGLVGSVATAMVQLGAPDDRRSAVLTVYAMVAAVFAVGSGVAIGLLSDATAVWLALGVLGVLLEVFAVVGGRQRVFADLDRIEVPEQGAPGAALP